MSEEMEDLMRAAGEAMAATEELDKLARVISIYYHVLLERHVPESLAMALTIQFQQLVCLRIFASEDEKEEE